MNYRKIIQRLLVLGLLALVPAQAMSQASALNNAVRDYNGGNYEKAAFGFYEVAAFDPVIENKLKAQYYLAQSLLKMGLVRSAAFYYSAVMFGGPRHPYYLQAVEELIRISEEIEDDAFMPGRISDEYNAEFARLPPETLYKINYYTGLKHFRRENVEQALQFLAAVPKESSYYAKALFLQGIVKTFQGRAGGEAAVGDYEAILALRDSDEVTYWELANTQDLARLALGRIHYSLGNYADAVRWYETIQRYTPYWDVALNEEGWAAFMAEDVGTAMGTLHTLQAPQFKGAFRPESLILKATVYYYACLYEEVQKELAAFDRRYKPMAAQVRAMLESHPGTETLPYYYDLVTRPSSEGDSLPKAVRNLLLGNQKIQSLIHYVEIIDGEIEQVEKAGVWKDSLLQKETLKRLREQREANVKITGQFIQSRLQKLVDEVSNFDGQADILRFETSKAEKELLEAGVDPATRLKGQDLLRPAMPDESWQYWAFEGEWWVDELGFYKYTLKSACDAPASGAAGN